jgi:hypothetical protein
MVTGSTSNSRLKELKKYAVGVPFSQQYVGNGSLIVDGVAYSDPDTVSGKSVVYYISAIRYFDVLTGASSGTTYSFTPQGIDNPLNFINTYMYQDPKKENIISNPKIIDDVFIIRQELSAFDRNYKLEYIKNLNELLTYAGGNYFNIINNS